MKDKWEYGKTSKVCLLKGVTRKNNQRNKQTVEETSINLGSHRQMYRERKTKNKSTNNNKRRNKY